MAAWHAVLALALWLQGCSEEEPDSEEGSSSAAVILGPAGNTCPPSHPAKFADRLGCRCGMHVVGHSVGDIFNGVERDSGFPSGCYYCEDVQGCVDGAWMNTHEDGVANGGAKPYCAVENFIQQGSTLFVGDSDIDYWPNPTPISESCNVGWGGYTCVDLLAEIDDLLSFFSPKTVILVCGENDFAVGDSVSEAFAAFEAVVDKIIATGARIITIGTKPEPGTTELHSKYRDYDEQVQAHASSLAASSTMPPLVVIDSYNSFEDVGNPGSLYDSDDLHMSAEGYALWSTWLTQAYSDLNEQGACYVWRSGECTAAIDS
jgi:lysophospholipase L1-like esterase